MINITMNNMKIESEECTNILYAAKKSRIKIPNL